jgi:hypothetical protein
VQVHARRAWSSAPRHSHLQMVWAGRTVVALATGLKVLGRHHMAADGSVAHDSHAEVLARRAFQAYLWDQAERCMRGDPSILVRRAEPPNDVPATTMDRPPPLAIAPGVSFHFYVSHTPCTMPTVLVTTTCAQRGRR